MKRSTQQALPALLLCAAAAFAPTQSAAEDIDIFTGAGAGSNANPKILIVLDNTSNWSRMNQKWPGGLQQGQSEARAINTVLGSIGSEVNLGLMEFVTGNPATATGGFIRQAVVPMTDANKSNFSKQLNTIFNNVTDPDEKKNSGTEYGNLMYDAYNYFAGANAVSPEAVLAAKADPNGYTSTYTRFKSPLSDANACGRNFVIFIGNPNASGPAADTAANGTALAALGGSASPQLQVPAFSMVTSTTVDNLGYDSQCVASQSACTTTDYAAQCAAGGLYASCSCSSTSTPTRAACPSGTQRYSVVGYTVTGGTPTSDGGINAANPTKGISGCHASPSASDAAGDKGGLIDPVNSVTTVAGTTTQINYTNVRYTASTSPSTAVTQDCPPTVALAPAVAPATNPVTNLLSITSPSTGCYSSINQWPTTDHGTLPSSYPDPYSVSGNTTIRYTITGYDGAIAAVNDCSSGKRVTVTQHVTSVATTTTSTPNYKYDVTQTYTKETITTAGSVSTPTTLGDTVQCYPSGSDAYSATSSPVGEFAGACGAYNSCASGAPSASADQCTSGTARYMVTGTFTGTNVTPTGTFITPSTAANADEWAQFMHRPHAINTASATDTIKQTITTYTIDVFNAQQNAEETELYMSMARVGGGKYFAARNEEAIVTALKKILIEIQSVNTTFASASLPVNATNRTQNANQVFIGMFRPDPDANPRWYGNLKQYAIGKVASGDLDLVDKNNKPATNVLTGFIDDCAASFWTTGSLWPTDSTKNYWANIVVNPDPASKCDATTLSAISGAVYSDLPDGPTVEKGAVAEVLRKGNNPGATPTWTTANRNVLTGTSSSLVAFTTTSSGLGADLVNFTKGADVINSTPATTPADPGNNTGLYNASTNPNQTRPSIHGDVVHSRPLPVNYGAAGVSVYYGTNDGMLHAVDASNGKERWAYVAPEFYATNTKLQRLMDNGPGVNYHTEATKNFGPKDYFFDGSIGIYQGAAGTNPPVWIYPTQRRGGRMIYAFDVTDPTSNPTLKWRHGCTGGTCDAGFAQMGQTWSTPNVAFINGYSPDRETKPVVVMGGGYDSCEDAQAVTPSCGSTKGNAVYFMDADTGALITSFATTRAVAADVNMIDINNDGLVDYAYVADVGGNIYRIDFVSSPSTPTALPYPTSINNTSDATHWFMHRVAYTGQGRKFLFGPGLFPSGTSTYLAIVSGDREHPLITDYPYTSLPYPNKAYVYKDSLNSTPSTAAVDLDGADMLNQTALTDATCTSRNLLSNTDKKGWFMDLNQYGDKNANGVTGEQGVTAAVIVGGMVAFSTNRPFSSGLSCNTRLGEARGYFVNLFNGSGAIGTANNAACGGSRSTAFAGGGLPPSPVIGLVPIDGVPTAVLIGAVQRDGGSASPIKPSKITPPINRTRTRTYKYIKGDS